VVEEAASCFGIPIRREEQRVMIGGGETQEGSLLLVKPKTFMNQCGPAIAALLERRQTSVSQLVVVHDDLDLPLGRIRFKTKGAHGGHNGIRSIITSLATHHFIRLKIGIGRPPASGDASEFVLTPFSSREAKIVAEAIQQAVEAIRFLMREGIQKAMNKFNTAL
jgi:PTH1 family peptidyl-tRNA hydrolase